MPSQSIPPLDFMNYYRAKYPAMIQQIDGFLEQKRNKELDWPDWCFMPLAAGYAIASEGKLLSPFDPRIHDIARIIAAGTWRMTKGIYRFDTDIFNLLWTTPIAGDIPIEPLFRLPEWCVYIETPNRHFLGVDMTGFFAWMEFDVNVKRAELRLILLLANNEHFPVILHITGGTIEKCLAEVEKEAIQNAVRHGIEFSGNSMPNIASEVTPLLSVLLYLCSQNSEISNAKNEQPTLPQTKKIKGKDKLFAAESIKVWDVAVRMGSALRNAAAKENAPDESSSSGSSKRPHIRRAHWHSFWTGKKGEQIAQVKWLPPMAINVSNDDDLPATIRIV